jgi:hypothetical protein
MQEPYISDRQGCQTLPGTGKKANHNTGSEFRGVRGGHPCPRSTACVDDKGQNVTWATSKFIDERHPKKVADTLKVSRECGWQLASTPWL